MWSYGNLIFIVGLKFKFLEVLRIPGFYLNLEPDQINLNFDDLERLSVVVDNIVSCVKSGIWCRNKFALNL